MTDGAYRLAEARLRAMSARRADYRYSYIGVALCLLRPSTGKPLFLLPVCGGASLRLGAVPLRKAPRSCPTIFRLSWNVPGNPQSGLRPTARRAGAPAGAPPAPGGQGQALHGPEHPALEAGVLLSRDLISSLTSWRLVLPSAGQGLNTTGRWLRSAALRSIPPAEQGRIWVMPVRSR